MTTPTHPTGRPGVFHSVPPSFADTSLVPSAATVAGSSVDTDVLRFRPTSSGHVVRSRPASPKAPTEGRDPLADLQARFDAMREPMSAPIGNFEPTTRTMGTAMSEFVDESAASELAGSESFPILALPTELFGNLLSTLDNAQLMKLMHVNRRIGEVTLDTFERMRFPLLIATPDAGPVAEAEQRGFDRSRDEYRSLAFLKGAQRGLAKLHKVPANEVMVDRTWSIRSPVEIEVVYGRAFAVDGLALNVMPAKFYSNFTRRGFTDADSNSVGLLISAMVDTVNTFPQARRIRPLMTLMLLAMHLDSRMDLDYDSSGGALGDVSRSVDWLSEPKSADAARWLRAFAALSPASLVTSAAAIANWATFQFSSPDDGDEGWKLRAFDVPQCYFDTDGDLGPSGNDYLDALHELTIPFRVYVEASPGELDRAASSVMIDFLAAEPFRLHQYLRLSARSAAEHLTSHERLARNEKTLDIAELAPPDLHVKYIISACSMPLNLNTTIAEWNCSRRMVKLLLKAPSEPSIDWTMGLTRFIHTTCVGGESSTDVMASRYLELALTLAEHMPAACAKAAFTVANPAGSIFALETTWAFVHLERLAERVSEDRRAGYLDRLNLLARG